METKTLYTSKWLMALLTGNLTEDISKKLGEFIKESGNNDYFYVFDKLLNVECKKILNNKETLDSALNTIKREYEYIGIDKQYGNVNEIITSLKFELEALENISDAHEYVVKCYDQYKDSSNEPMKIGAFYVLLSYMVDKHLIDSHLELVQSINDYLSDKDNDTIRNNAYYNIFKLISAERIMKYVVIH